MLGRRANCAWLLVCWLVSTSHALDWPTFRHDNRRSGCTSERIEAAQLDVHWVWRSDHEPQPAWSGPAKWDAYANLRGLRSMRNYDPVFHVIAARGTVWFGSSADDSVVCLDATTGREKWAYMTDGPVRIAPTLADGRLYFGSDDGHAYCLQADTGELNWKHCPGARDRLILNNSRAIPLWPCRTGVLVAEGTAYFAAGMLPWKPSYLCAVDAKTGRAEGAGRYVSTLSAVTLEGALLASEKRLYALQGRIPPLLFDRVSGRSEGQLKKGGGGSFALLTEDARILHGPGNKTGWITESDSDSRDQVATFPGANAMLVSGDRAYVLADRSIAALDRAKGERLWTKPYALPYELILAGDVLFAGGDDAVAAIDTKTGNLVWRQEVTGRAYGLAVADGALLVSTDEGYIYCFRPGSAKTADVAVQRGSPDPAGSADRQVSLDAGKDILAVGPYLVFIDNTSASVRWETAGPSPTKLVYGNGQWSRPIENAAPKTRHEVRLTDLRKDTVYRYVIEADGGGKTLRTPAFECDTCGNYSLPPIPDRPCPYPAQDEGAGGVLASQNVVSWLRTTRSPGAEENASSQREISRGICLVLGSGDGRLVYELARRSPFRVIGLDTDANHVASARKALKRAGLYGVRAAIHQVESLDKTPLVGNLANVVVLGGWESWREAIRLLQPGGTACLIAPGRDPGQTLRALTDAGAPGAELVQAEHTAWIRLVAPPLANTGVWSHQYGLPDNSGYGGESLAGSAGCGDLDVQWLGPPGPRAQADRNGRKPSPLAVAGRLFMQGLHRIIALDAHNGTILWSLEIPHFERFNVPRDTSNWCADQDHVFAAVRDKCWRIDAADGHLSKFYTVVSSPRAPRVAGNERDRKDESPAEAASWDWGYAGRPRGGQLIGSAVRAGTSWTDFWGGHGWYDAKSGNVTYPICCDDLFSLDVETGSTQWTYARGLILHPTITLTADRAYFVECRHPQVLAADARRVGRPELWQDQFLVALDLTSGQPVWERPLDTAAGTVVFYLAAGEGTLVLVASDHQYHVYAFDAKDGSAAWSVDFPWPMKDGKPVDNHGRHMSRPAIFGDRVFVRPRVINLADGKLQEALIPDGGCGTYAVTDRLLVFRSSNVTLWDFYAGQTSAWPRLRPDCWLSTIPACGMLLSPEAGGGCSCGSWLETSLGFAPVSHAAK